MGLPLLSHNTPTLDPPAPPPPTLPQSPAPPSAGILGPTLAVEVGQTLEITFRNSLPFPANLMLDGGLELLPAGGPGNRTIAAEAPVAPGATVTYRYYVPERWAVWGFFWHLAGTVHVRFHAVMRALYTCLLQP